MKNKEYVINNKVVSYIDVDSLKGLGYFRISDLRDKYVVYSITIENESKKKYNSKIYIGSSGDIGERLETHVKDSRSSSRELYRDIRKYGKCTFHLIEVCNTRDEMKARESFHIIQYKEKLLRSLGNERFLMGDEEIKHFLENYMYNILN